MLFTKLTLCSQIRNIVLTVAMNLVFIYLGEECLVTIYSVSELAMGKVPVCFEPAIMAKHESFQEVSRNNLYI